MGAIKIRNKSGEFKEVPAFKGSDGTGAYEEAVEGGYTGTKEEFQQSLADIGTVETVLETI